MPPRRLNGSPVLGTTSDLGAFIMPLKSSIIMQTTAQDFVTVTVLYGCNHDYIAGLRDCLTWRCKSLRRHPSTGCGAPRIRGMEQYTDDQTTTSNSLKFQRIPSHLQAPVL